MSAITLASAGSAITLIQTRIFETTTSLVMFFSWLYGWCLADTYLFEQTATYVCAVPVVRAAGYLKASLGFTRAE
jgi:hypothetical protein